MATKRSFATLEEKKAVLEETRQKLLAESKSEKQMRPRYGMFSYTGCLAIGENSQGVKKFPELDPDTGKPKLGPKPFITNPGKKGQLS